MLDFLETNKDITEFSNFKTPAKSEYFFEVASEQDLDRLTKVYAFAKIQNMKILILGGGTNMLFAFDVYKGIVIKNNLQGCSYNRDTKILELYSNEIISDIATNLESHYGQKIWHRFIGLPGTVGGAIYGNAGCFGLEIENNIIDITILDVARLKIETLTKAEALFSYRNSLFKKSGNYFIIKARFDLNHKIEKYHSDVDNIYFRENKQPKGYTCGSFFKNPKVNVEKFWKDYPKLYNEKLKAISAGFLLESSGLKGYQIGGAFFSPLHANFLMSDGTATSQDIGELISYAKKIVREKFGVNIENEVRIIS